MPGQIKQLTPDELAKLETFPFPVSGTVRMLEGGERNHYLFECIGVTGADSMRLQEFCDRINGSPFRFESATHRFPHCCFGNGTMIFTVNGPNRCSVQLLIDVLPPYTT